jgi:hypothetical protein
MTDPAPEGLPAVPAPDLLGPVFGFRDWRVTDEGLCSPRTGVVWTNRVHEAVCRPRTPEDFVRPPHPAPGRDCTCGVHAAYYASDEMSKVDHRGVSGIVTVWGRVEAHAHGMRAEFARAEALGVYARWTRRQKRAVADVAEALEVDLVDLADLADAAHAYATPLPAVGDTEQRLVLLPA